MTSTSPAPPAGSVVRCRRRLRSAAVLAAGPLRSVADPLSGPRARRHRAVCAAARLLTALDVRVRVIPSPVAWPRSDRGPGLLVVANSAGPLDLLALLTVLPAAVPADRGAGRVPGVRLPTVPATVGAVADALTRGTPVLVRPEQPARAGAALGRFSPTLFAAAVDRGAAVCPVAVRYRCEGGPPLAGASLRWALAARGVVVDVHLLPALAATGVSPAELATLAEYAVADVLEGPPRARPQPSVTFPSTTTRRRVVSTAASIRRSWVTRSRVPR
ncbi:MAG TPA: hypothetical protein VHF92_19230 [Geodermatophilus sp.]|nr:hypothetical protein [Geodermatophilus sp.]